VWPLRNLPSGGSTGPVEKSAGVGSVVNGLEDREVVEVVESVLSVLDWRDLRRKGMDGMRKVGKTEGMEWGSEGLRRKDISYVGRVNGSQ